MKWFCLPKLQRLSIFIPWACYYVSILGLKQVQLYYTLSSSLNNWCSNSSHGNGFTVIDRLLASTSLVWLRFGGALIIDFSLQPLHFLQSRARPGYMLPNELCFLLYYHFYSRVLFRIIFSEVNRQWHGQKWKQQQRQQQQQISK